MAGLQGQHGQQYNMTLYLWVVLVVTSVFKVSSQCDHGEVRLVGGSRPHEGRVEVCIVSQWSRVCSFNWNNYDATVVCRQLGYSLHGATTSEFGQGDGPTRLNNVLCDPNINKALLECYSEETSYVPCFMHDAGVKCTDEPRVKNITAHILNTSSISSVHTVLVTWEQNLTVDEPTSFKVECHNEHYGIIITVSNESSNAQLRGLLSFSYNCCVTAVYPLYETREICTGINAMSTTNHSCVTTMQSRISECEESRYSDSATVIVGGVLGIIIVILIGLLSLSVVCLMRQHTKIRVISESIPTQQNVSYSLVAVKESHLTTSETPTHASDEVCQ